jgi:hypothetical protein
MQSLVVHQSHVASIIMMHNDAESAGLMEKFLEHYGNSHRTFRHGLLHGSLAGFMLALPIIGVNALFEARGARYIAINAGYWIISMGLMGGIISAFG